MAKQKSDIVRDKIIKARSKGERSIVLTDEEACEIWSSLLSVEVEVYNLKKNTMKSFQESYSKLEKYLKVAKKEILNIRLR